MTFVLPWLRGTVNFGQRLSGRAIARIGNPFDIYRRRNHIASEHNISTITHTQEAAHTLNATIYTYNIHCFV